MKQRNLMNSITSLRRHSTLNLLTWWYFSSDILTTVERLNFVGGRTSTSAALRLLRTDLFTEQRGVRDDVPQVAVLITDGGLDSFRETTHEVCFATHSLSAAFLFDILPTTLVV